MDSDCRRFVAELAAFFTFLLCIGSFTSNVSPGNRSHVLQRDAQIPQSSRHLLEEEEEAKGGGVELRIVHRYSPGSPHWKPHYADRSKLVEELMAMDKARIEQFRRVLEDAQQLGRSDLEMALPPGIPEESTARLEHPLAPGAHDTTVSSRLVSGSYIGSGQYFVDFELGSPPQKFPLIVDTGSDLTWVRCLPSCNASSSSSSSGACSSHSGDATAPPWFLPRKSSSFHDIPCTAGECLLVPAPQNSSCSARRPRSCDYTYGYGDQSRTTGTLAYETVSMSSSSSSSAGRESDLRIEKVVFGCGTENVGNSFLGASGVLGLGQGAVSFSTQAGFMLGGVFSYCLVDYLAPARANASSVLAFGRRPAISGAKKEMALQYTPIVRNPVAESFYYVNVEHVAVGGAVIDRKEGWELDREGNLGTIFDSGSTLSYFREPAFSKIIRALERTIKLPPVKPFRGFNLCYNVSSSQHHRRHSSHLSSQRRRRHSQRHGQQHGQRRSHRHRLPEVSIAFEGGAVLRPPPENYMVLVAEDVKCVGFLPVQTWYGFNILGNLLQQNFHVEYDRAESRLGFAWSPCSSRN